MKQVLKKWYFVLPLLLCISCEKEEGDGKGPGSGGDDDTVYLLPEESKKDWDYVCMTNGSEPSRNMEMCIKEQEGTEGYFVYVNRPGYDTSEALTIELDENLKVVSVAMNEESWTVEQKEDRIRIVRYLKDGSCKIESYPVKGEVSEKMISKAGGKFSLIDIINSLNDFRGDIGNLLDVYEGDWKSLLISAAEGGIISIIPSPEGKLAASITFEAAHKLSDALNEGKRFVLFDKCTPYIGLKNKDEAGIYSVTVDFDNQENIPPFIRDDYGNVINNHTYCGIVVGKEKSASFYDYEQRTLCQSVEGEPLIFTLEPLEAGVIYTLTPFLISGRDLQKVNSGIHIDPQLIRYGTSDYIEDFNAKISDFSIEQNSDYSQSEGLLVKSSLTVSLPPTLEIDSWGVEITVGKVSEILYADNVNQLKKTFQSSFQVYRNMMNLDYDSYQATIPVSARVFIQHKGNAFYSYGESVQKMFVYDRKPSIRFSNARMVGATCYNYLQYGVCNDCKNRVENVPCYDLVIDGSLWFDGNYVMYWDSWYAGENWVKDLVSKNCYDFYQHFALYDYQASTYYYTYSVNGTMHLSDNKIRYTWGKDSDDTPCITGVSIEN